MPSIGDMDLVEAPEGVAGVPVSTLDTFLTAISHGDARLAASVYHVDALLLSPSGDLVSGRSAIEQFWQSGIEVGLGSVELQPLSQATWAALVYELGRFRMVLARATGRPAVERGRYLIVHVQSQGSWRWAVSAFGTVDERHEQHITTAAPGRSEQ